MLKTGYVYFVNALDHADMFFCKMFERVLSNRLYNVAAFYFYASFLSAVTSENVCDMTKGLDPLEM